jgi:hypothetical protein
MAFKQFPKQQYFRQLNTDDVTKVGYIKVSTGVELTAMMVTIYVQGVIVTPFDFRVNVYGSPNSSVPIFTSEWAEISAATLLNNDVDPAIPYVNNWLGNIYVDFNYEPLNPNLNYYISVETDGYTRVGETFYIGVNLDWYSPVNNQLDGPLLAGVRVRPIGYRELDT